MRGTWSWGQTRLVLCQLRVLIVVVLVVDIFVIFRLTVLDDSLWLCSDNKQLPAAGVSENSSPHTLSFVIWDFEDFENDLVGTVKNISTAKAGVMIVSDHVPYPPIMLPKVDNIQLVITAGQLGSSLSESRPEFRIRSASYVFLVPDGIRIAGDLDDAVKFLTEVSSMDHTVAMVVFPVESAKVLCLDIHVDAKRWTVEYQTAHNDTVCDAIDSKEFVVLMRKDTLLNLTWPFLRPFSKALFIQTAYHRLRLIIDRQRILSVYVKSMHQDDHNSWKHKQNEQLHLQQSYEQLGIKLIKQGNGQQEWHGCSKDTSRCFGSVLDDIPEYIHIGRWTPPCCLQALRETAKHVFQILESEKVRYWLEGGSLLGAARTGDIIPWDYDIDIGIYRDDISRCRHLSGVSRTGIPIVDSSGFVWEKAAEGDFYRIHYSQSNHLHVDVFPFYSRNGTMTKDTWFKSHRQDTEFPESFIQPLGRISFAGFEASAPKDVRRFLEFKFGKGVIENPRLPNSETVG